MGMSRKLNRMMLPRCFHSISCAHLPPPDDDAPAANGRSLSRRRRHRGAVMRLVKSDGGVVIYERPMRAWELMEEFPKHLVCRSDCFYIGQITPALSDHDRLLLGHNYFLLPANFFQSALSFATFIRCRSVMAAGRPPFELEKTPAGGLRVKVTEEMIIQQHNEMEVARRIIRVCTTPQLKKDYDMLVGRRLHWKPKLDTISEHKGSRHNKILRKTKSNVV